MIPSRVCRSAYPEKKLSENIEAEIMQVVLDEARGAYREEIVIELPSNTVEDVRLDEQTLQGAQTLWACAGSSTRGSFSHALQVESNVARTISWLQQWRPDEGASAAASSAAGGSRERRAEAAADGSGAGKRKREETKT